VDECKPLVAGPLAPGARPRYEEGTAMSGPGGGALPPVQHELPAGDRGGGGSGGGGGGGGGDGEQPGRGGGGTGGGGKVGRCRWRYQNPH